MTEIIQCKVVLHADLKQAEGCIIPSLTRTSDSNEFIYNWPTNKKIKHSQWSQAVKFCGSQCIINFLEFYHINLFGKGALFGVRLRSGCPSCPGSKQTNPQKKIVRSFKLSYPRLFSIRCCLGQLWSSLLTTCSLYTRRSICDNVNAICIFCKQIILFFLEQAGILHIIICRSEKKGGKYTGLESYRKASAKRKLTLGRTSTETQHRREVQYSQNVILPYSWNIRERENTYLGGFVWCCNGLWDSKFCKVALVFSLYEVEM